MAMLILLIIYILYMLSDKRRSSSRYENVLQLGSRRIDIRYLEWDSINTRHIAEKGIKYSDIEDAILYGEWDIRRGRRVERRRFVIQRYDLVAKSPRGIKYKIVLEPVDRKEGLWRVVTAWKAK